MTSLAICSVLIGSMLGVRFRFIVLLPIIFLGFAVLIGISITRDGTFSQTILMLTIFASCLQFGYLFASVVKCAVVPINGQTLWRPQRRPKFR